MQVKSVPCVSDNSSNNNNNNNNNNITNVNKNSFMPFSFFIPPQSVLFSQQADANRMGAASPNLYSLCGKTTRPCFLVFSKRTSIMSVLILIFSSIFFTEFKISLYSQYAINNNDINISFCRVLIILYNGLRCALPESFVKIHCR